MAKVKKTFRIEEDAYDELVELSAGWGVAQGAAIERAIRLARQMPDTLPDTCQTGASTHDSELCKMFGTTVEQVESDCEKYESGDFSGWEFGKPIDGRPKAAMRTTSLKFSETELTAIDNAAKRLGLTRSAFIRRACDNEIMAIA